MAFVVKRPGGTWELRSSAATAAGPRSRTLISFRTLSPDNVERAVERSEGELRPEDVREAARRAGAPVDLDPMRQAGVELIRGLGRGSDLPRSWRRPLSAMLTGKADDSGDAEVIAEWADADPARRGEALTQLLLLADAIEDRTERGELSFPGLKTRPRTRS